MSRTNRCRHGPLTAGHLLEVDNVLVRLQRVTRRQVRVDVALLQPRVVVPGETRRYLLAVMHTLVQRLELAVELTAALDVEAVVFRQRLLLLLCRTRRSCVSGFVSRTNPIIQNNGCGWVGGGSTLESNPWKIKFCFGKDRRQPPTPHQKKLVSPVKCNGTLACVSVFNRRSC